MKRADRPDPVPTVATPVLIHYRDEHGKRQFTTPDLASLTPFERTTPVRAITRYPGQTNTPGYYWSATDNRHLEYESHLECQWMTMLDFDSQVVAISAQPMHIQCLDSRGSWEHFPDLFVRLADGNGRVVDVKDPSRVDDADVQRQAARTRDICEDAGFDYAMVSTPPLIPLSNIRWLSAYRRPIELPGGLQDRVRAQAAEPIRIGDLVDAFDIPELAFTAVMRACWFGQLSFDLNAPLRDHTLVRATEEES